jgi:UDP-N-acetylmuramate: L-alanyl-gamma-D-glutamyl-meso-diaminopimelate ligase
MPQSGLIVANGQEDSLKRVIERGCWTPLTWFNTEDTYRLDGDDASGELILHGAKGEIGRTRWNLTGDHNRANACAALLAAQHVGVALGRGLEALSRFENVKRRLEVCGSAKGITVYDDFAHHPTAIETTLAGLRRRIGSSRILAVLEPRSNTMKLGVMKDRLPESLAAADKVFCYAGNLGWDAAGALAPLGDKAVVEEDFDRLLTAITTTAQTGDHVLVMSNGGFNGIHGKLLAKLTA